MTGSDFDERYIRIAEFARLAGLTKATLYQYNCLRSYGMPRPARAIGPTKFWLRTDALTWIASRDKYADDFDFG
jgi:predicted DNA-binding transcriptional regulator AlpA